MGQTYDYDHDKDWDKPYSDWDAKRVEEKEDEISEWPATEEPEPDVETLLPETDESERTGDESDDGRDLVRFTPSSDAPALEELYLPPPGSVDVAEARKNAELAPTQDTTPSAFETKLDASPYSSTDPKYAPPKESYLYQTFPGGYVQETKVVEQKDGPFSTIKPYEGLATDPQQAQELNRPTAATAMLQDNFKDMSQDGVLDLNTPPASMSADQKELFDYINANPALRNAIDAGSDATKTPDGKINAADITSFLEAQNDAVTDATKEFEDWKTANPDAGEQATELARNASLLKAYTPITAQADPNNRGANPDQYTTPAGLTEIATNNPGLPPALKAAAALFQSPGMFEGLDTGGNNPALKSDNLMGSADISAWLKNAAPKNDLQFTALVSDAALENLTASTDTAKFGPGIFDTPPNPAYTPAEGAAVLHQLTETKQALQAGTQAGFYNDFFAGRNDLNTNPEKIDAELSEKINKLQSDPEVQKYLKTELPKAQQEIINADPALRKAAADYFENEILTGKALETALSAKDADGNPVTAGQAAAAFAAQAEFYNQALGHDGKTAGSADLSISIVQNTPQLSQQLTAAFQDQIVSGQQIDTLVAQGMPMQDAIAKTMADNLALGKVLPPEVVTAGQQQFRQNLMEKAGDTLMNDPETAKAITSQMTEEELAGVVEKMLEDVPEGTYKDDNGNPIANQDIVRLTGAVWNDVRNGTKFQDALQKLKIVPEKSALTTAYGSGVMHAAQSIIGAVAFGFNVSNTDMTPEQKLGAASGALQFTSQLGEGASKFWENKTFENVFKGVGGIGSVVTGALAISSGIEQLRGGNPIGGINIAAGATGVLGGAFSVAEGFSFLAGASEALVSGLAVASSGLSIIGGVLAIGAVYGGIIYEGVKFGNNATAYFDNNLSPTLKQYAINGGPQTTEDYQNQPNWLSLPQPVGAPQIPVPQKTVPA